ncbi:MAG TPA: MFS transporter [Hyphomicrobiaceae bacterium]|nr:MFS transporter [Hyphomicrobiaceae bacterium]
MTSLLRPVTALLLAASILLMGNGLLGILLPLRADLESFSQIEIGIMGSAHYVGLVVGCVFAPLVIARVGHIRAFAAFTASATITPLLHAIWPDPFFWTLLRALNGLCFAGLFMGIESWLTASSTLETRGRVLAAYTFLNFTVVIAGLQMMGLADPRGFELFSLVAILYSLSAVPVALTATAAPVPPRSARLRLGWLVDVSPAAVLGCLFAGLANGAFWSLAPLYGKGTGLSLTETAMLITIAVIGGAGSQWPVGSLSDRLGRRVPLMGVATGAACAGMGLFSAAGSDALWKFVLIAVYGTCAFPIYALCVAHANDLVPKERAVDVSSGLLLTFSIGAVCGPLFASLAMSLAGPGALFLHSAVAHGLIAITLLIRVKLRPSLPEDDKEGFIAVPRTTPAVFELDPRAEPRSPPPAAAEPAAAEPSPAAATPTAAPAAPRG